jgi:hypothetical protein
LWGLTSVFAGVFGGPYLNKSAGRPGALGSRVEVETRELGAAYFEVLSPD